MECLAIWNKCNNKCLMCSNPSNYDKWGDYGLKNISSRIEKISANEREVYLTGGEPTIHPDFFKVMDSLKKRCSNARIILDTNGRMFCYDDFLNKFFNYSNIEFQVSLCGQNAALHDKITRTRGSFNQVVLGIKNILKLKLNKSEVEVRVVIHKLTLFSLKNIYKFVSNDLMGIKRLIFIFMEYEGMAGKNKKTIGVTYNEVGPFLEKIFRKTKEAPFEIRLYHFPLCVLPPKFWPYLWRTLPEKEITFLPSCQKCFYKNYCLGIHRDYLRVVGGEEFKPIKKRINLKISDNFYHPIISVN
ncbi:MAG: radical SAM protein [Candidatus Pacebacteria bacterium]|nr:radical SAM protein [Candidatus Paceibacterota bacterium]